jgi:hypothetical protein
MLEAVAVDLQVLLDRKGLLETVAVAVELDTLG